MTDEELLALYGYGSSGYGFEEPYDSYYDSPDVDYGFGLGDYTTTPSQDDINFEQDWADMLAGNFTIDEVTNNQDIAANSDVASWGSDWSTAISNIAKGIGQKAFDALKSTFTKKDANGNTSIDWPALATAGVGLYKATQGGGDTGGYNKPVPKMDMVREQIQYNDPNRRPGETGRQYFTDPRFAAQGDAGALNAARSASAEQASGIQAAYQPRAAQAPNPYAGKMNLAFSQPSTTPAKSPAQTSALPQIPTQPNEQGGINMAEGGLADAGRYLQGKTDGMADEIPSSIDGEQPAALSHGEFVIPADVVSHLGNGNSDAGAQKLYEMMDRIRQARTGTTEQGKEINPDEFTMGGLANAYAGGGEVKGFAGPDGSAVVNPTATAAPAGGVPLDTSKTSTLSPWVGDYVTNALGQGAALAQAPYQVYQGPLTAGPSGLQQQAFAGSSEMAQAGYNPAQFTGGLFDTQAASQYMNPYLSAVLDPQLKELQRQNTIANMNSNSKLTGAGAFGGGRQAVMTAENTRNLMDQVDKTLGQGYGTAYDKAMAQFNTDQGRSLDVQRANEASRQYGADFGLKSISQLADLGATDRGITSEGIAADKAQFEQGRDWAYQMPQYQLGLLNGLPTGASTSSVNQDALSKLQSDVSGLASIYQQLSKLGQA